MSDKEPTINVTRGSNRKRRGRTPSSDGRSRSSSGIGLPGPGALVSGVIRGVRNAWWAGLGVFAVVQDAGSQVFDALVEEGKSWEQAQREQARKRVRQVQQFAEEEEAVEAVERRVREEVDTVLRRIGVPRRDDLDALHEQVDTLSEKIEHLSETVSEEKKVDGR